MAEDHRSRGLPTRESAEDSQYPPPPGEEDERSRSYHLPPPMSSGVTLPSIHDSQAAYGPPPAGRGYPPQDPRSRGGYSASPTNSNGYPPPGGYAPLPPLYGGHDARMDPAAAAYYAAGRPPYPDPYGYPGYRPPPGGPYAYPPDYARAGVGGPPSAQQAAPRQRTSIACRYCRKRKIRCSGYQNTTNGKCTNCDKLRIECVFQPVSSNATQAFIPVNAIPGGVPPGTPLYGAYGQPLPPAGSVGNAPPYGGHPPPHDYQMPLASPTGNYPPPLDDRGDPDRRRGRPQDDDHARRLPPPGPYQDDDMRRRSPASNQSSNTPPASYVQHGGMREVDRTPTPQRNSPAGAAPGPPGSTSSASVMSLGNLMDHTPSGGGRTSDSIDQSMLGRLNRRS